MEPVLVFDIETVPDVAGLRRLAGHPDSVADDEVARLAFERRREKTGSDFLALHLHGDRLRALAAFAAAAATDVLDGLVARALRQHTRLGAFLGGLAWWTLVPSELSGMRRLVASANGSQAGAPADYVAAAADPGGALALAYVPSTGTAAQTFTIS